MFSNRAAQLTRLKPNATRLEQHRFLLLLARNDAAMIQFTLPVLRRVAARNLYIEFTTTLRVQFERNMELPDRAAADLIRNFVEYIKFADNIQPTWQVNFILYYEINEGQHNGEEQYISTGYYQFSDIDYGAVWSKFIEALQSDMNADIDGAKLVAMVKVV